MLQCPEVLYFDEVLVENAVDGLSVVDGESVQLVMQDAEHEDEDVLMELVLGIPEILFYLVVIRVDSQFHIVDLLVTDDVVADGQQELHILLDFLVVHYDRLQVVFLDELE